MLIILFSSGILDLILIAISLLSVKFLDGYSVLFCSRLTSHIAGDVALWSWIHRSFRCGFDLCSLRSLADCHTLVGQDAV